MHPALGLGAESDAGRPIGDRPVTVREFAGELTALSRKFADWDKQEHTPSHQELSQLRGSLPRTWTIQSEDGSFVISSAPLDAALAAGDAGDSETWIAHALGEVTDYAVPPRLGNEGARAQLDRILASQEFNDVRPLDAWQLFRQRLAAWFTRLLYRLFAGLHRHPIAGDILFWTLLVLAVGLLARWFFRMLVRFDRVEGLPGQEISTANRTWQEWIRLARAAAARQDFREAIHAAYWAGIARLEDAAVLPRDRAKTPRERLAAVSHVSQQELAARRLNYAGPLRSLTARLERAWYADRGAKAEDFEESLEELKALGCPLE